MATEDRIDLTKKVGIVLEKRKLFNLMVKVGAAFDVSGSTQGLFANGTMQRALNRVFAIADKVDDNHTLDTWIFSNHAKELEGINPDNVDTYAADVIMKTDDEVDEKGKRVSPTILWGGTRFTPFMQQILDFYYPTQQSTYTPEQEEPAGFFGKVKALFGVKKVAEPFVVVPAPVLAEEELPAFVMNFTDGENGDADQTEELIKSSQDKGVFWSFVGVGNEKFNFLKRIAATYPNVSFVDIRDLDKLSASDLYEALITEKFASWIKKNYPQAIEQAGQQREQGK